MAGWLMDGGRVVSGLTPCQSSSQKPEVKQAQTARHSWLRGGLTVGKFISLHCEQLGGFWLGAGVGGAAVGGVGGAVPPAVASIAGVDVHNAVQ